MEKMGAKTLFHKIKQTPGKPLWLGKIDNKVIFGLPGNPVSSFMCTIRYILPYLTQNFANKNVAILETNFSIKSNFTYFLQVNAQNINGKIIAKPIKGNGSGDFANLIEVNGFLELNFETEQMFQKGSVLPLWSF
jgi:molybdopterin molybdotransferase